MRWICIYIGLSEPMHFKDDQICWPQLPINQSSVCVLPLTSIQTRSLRRFHTVQYWIIFVCLWDDKWRSYSRLDLQQRWVLNVFNWLMNETWTSHQAKIKNECTDVNSIVFLLLNWWNVECESSGKKHVKMCVWERRWLHSTMIVWICSSNVLMPGFKNIYISFCFFVFFSQKL